MIQKQMDTRNLGLELFHGNLRKILTTHRKIKKAEEIESILNKMVQIIDKKPKNPMFYRVQRDIFQMLQSEQTCLLSGNLFMPNSESQKTLISQLENVKKNDWTFTLDNHFYDLLKMAENLVFSTSEQETQYTQSWYQNLSFICLLLIPRLKADKVHLALGVLMKLLPSIFKGPKDFIKGIFGIKSFRASNEMYDFCLEHGDILQTSLASFDQEDRELCSWLGRKVFELGETQGSLKSLQSDRVQQEGLEKHIQQQIEKLRRLAKDNKLKVAKVLK